MLDCLAFMQDDESRPGAAAALLGRRPTAAARAAVIFGAERLVLLKLVDVPPESPNRPRRVVGLMYTSARDRGSGICSRGGKLQTGAVVTFA